MTRRAEGPLASFFRAVCFRDFEVQSILAVEDRVLVDEDLLGQKIARSVSIICCHNELSISLINGESSSGPRVYSVSELVEFPKHWSRLGSFITSWLDSRAYPPMYNIFGHADTW